MVTDSYDNVPLSLRQHKHVEVISPASEPVWVDKRIASLLVALWNAGIETVYSCEGDAHERGYIYFTSDDDLHAFRRQMTGSSAEYALDTDAPIVRFDRTALNLMTRHLC